VSRCRSVAAGTATKQKHRQRRSEKRTGKNTWEEGAEVDHGVGEGRGVEDLPSVDLVGAELVGRLHPRRRQRERGGGRGEDGARVRQAAEEARRRSEWEWEGGTRAQRRERETPEHLSEDVMSRARRTEQRETAGEERKVVALWWASKRTGAPCYRPICALRFGAFYILGLQRLIRHVNLRPKYKTLADQTKKKRCYDACKQAQK
jgi:hypothetical protein